MSGPSYDEAVAGWLAHLRSGGTTTWVAYRADGDGAPPVHPTPDAAHLEVVRRLTRLAGRPVPAGLVDLVLTTPPSGRGMVDVPLPWPADPRPFGFPAVEPEDLPVEELVRLAVSVLARLAPGVPTQPTPQRPARWPLPWRRRFLLHGSPGTAAAVRPALLDQGLVESDWRATHVVVARSVEVMMAEHWASTSSAGGTLKWSTVWRRAVGADRLPGRLDAATVAQRLADRGREVHVVVAQDTAHAVEQVARVLGADAVHPPDAAHPDLARTDLVRRLNRLLALTEGPGRVRALTGTLLDRAIPAPDPGAEPPAPPRQARDWAATAAQTLADRLRDAGYAVHGDPGDLAPTHDPRPTGTVDRDRTLGLALSACLRAWQLQEDPA